MNGTTKMPGQGEGKGKGEGLWCTYDEHKTTGTPRHVLRVFYRLLSTTHLRKLVD